MNRYTFMEYVFVCIFPEAVKNMVKIDPAFEINLERVNYSIHHCKKFYAI